MKNRALLLVCAALMGAGEVLWASPQIFSAGFEAAEAVTWAVASGNWATRDGTLVGENGLVLFTLEFPTDRRVQVDVVSFTGDWLAIFGKYLDEQHWVQVVFSDKETRLTARFGEREVSWTGPARDVSGTTIVLAFVDARARVIVGDEIVIQVQDDVFASFGGRVGLAVQGRGVFDNLNASALTGATAVITSLGQSPGGLMVKLLADRVGLTYQYDAMAKPGVLEGAGALILVLGASSKGLGAAGISLDDEVVRGRELVAKARELGLPVIVMHIEGEARRGTLSDVLIKEFVPLADYVVVKADGNNDGLFTTLAQPHGIPLRIVTATAQVADVLADLFGLWR